MKKYTFTNLIYIIPFLFFIFASSYYHLEKSTTISYGRMDNFVVINEVPVAIMVADELKEHWQGLSDRKFLGSRNGMLFVFNNSQERTFVMRRMHFPLDIIWISDNKVVKIDKRLPPEGEEPKIRYQSGKPVDMVLEVNGGFTDAYGIRVGDTLEINIEK